MVAPMSDFSHNEARADRAFERSMAPRPKRDQWGADLPAPRSLYHDYGPQTVDKVARRSLSQRLNACMGEMEQSLALQAELNHQRPVD